MIFEFIFIKTKTFIVDSIVFFFSCLRFRLGYCVTKSTVGGTVTFQISTLKLRVQFPDSAFLLGFYFFLFFNLFSTNHSKFLKNEITVGMKRFSTFFCHLCWVLHFTVQVSLFIFCSFFFFCNL